MPSRRSGLHRSLCFETARHRAEPHTLSLRNVQRVCRGAEKWLVEKEFRTAAVEFAETLRPKLFDFGEGLAGTNGVDGRLMDEEVVELWQVEIFGIKALHRERDGDA